MAVKKALLISTGTEIYNRLLNLFSVLLFARLLTPSEIGIFIIASSIMVLASEVRMLGTSTYLIREQTLSQNDISNAIGLAIIISWGCACIIGVSSPLIADFYERPELILLIMILSVGFLLAPFVSTTHAILSRNFSFGRLFFVQSCGPTASLIVSLVFIQANFSYLSLAIGQAVGFLIDFLLALLLKPKEMKWSPKFTSIRKIAGVGIYASLINLFARLEVTIPDLILGKFTSSSFVAYFSRGLGLHLFVQELLLNGISRISLPYLAEQQRASKCLKTVYLQASELTLGFVLPPAIAAIFASDSLILLLFGSQWTEAGPLAKVLGVWACIRCLTYYAKPALITVKAEKSFFRIRFISILILITLITLSAIYSPSTATFSFVVYGILDFVLISYLLNEKLKMNVIEFLVGIRKSLYISAVCGSFSFLLTFYLSDIHYTFQVLVLGLTLLPLWFMCIFLLKHPLASHITELKKVVRKQ